LHITHPTSKLVAQCYGPFTVEKVISPVVFQLQLPQHWKIFNVFHTLLLTPYRETEEHGQNFEEPPPELVKEEPEYKVEQVLASQHYGHHRQLQYLLLWKRYSQAHNSWELADQIHAPELIKQFHKTTPLSACLISNGPVPTYDTNMTPDSSTSSHNAESLYNTSFTIPV
jgi:hypothetical protein